MGNRACRSKIAGRNFRMAGLEMEEFERHLEAVCSKLSFVKSVAIFAWTESSNLWRVTLSDDSFIDVYYSEITNKKSFAHIKDQKRVLGADNKKNWHWHPYEEPQRHDFTDGEISFDEFLKYVEEKISK